MASGQTTTHPPSPGSGHCLQISAFSPFPACAPSNLMIPQSPSLRLLSPHKQNSVPPFVVRPPQAQSLLVQLGRCARPAVSGRNSLGKRNSKPPGRGGTTAETGEGERGRQQSHHRIIASFAVRTIIGRKVGREQRRGFATAPVSAAPP
jgi:hypothetical protein